MSLTETGLMNENAYGVLEATGAGEVRLSPAGRPDYVTFILPEYVEAGRLPKPLEPYETMIAAALALRLPCRPRPWRSEKSNRHGDGSENPNDRIRNAANAYLLALERNTFGTPFENDVATARESLAVLRYWSEEIGDLLGKMLVYEVALKHFEAGATERMVD